MTNNNNLPTRESKHGDEPQSCARAFVDFVLADLEAAAAAFDTSGARCLVAADFDRLTMTQADSLEAFFASLPASVSERQQLRCKIDETLSGIGPRHSIVHLVRPGEGERTIDVRIARREIEGRACLVLVVRDTSNGSRLQQEFDSLARLAAVGQMTATVAHELNNIVTSMLGWTDIARRSANAATVVLPALEILEANSRRVKTLVGRILHQNRREPGSAVPLHLSEVVEDALRLLSWELADSGIRVVTQLASIPPVQGNDEQLHQVIVNLVRNAKDAMQGGGTLTVRIDLSSSGPLLVIEDTGQGIAPEVLPRIFEPFFTTKGHRDPSLPGGSGLGLAISRDIIENLGGRIEVESQQGIGTKFLVYLQAAEGEPKTPTIAPAEPTTPFLGLNVLVVDDERDVGEMIATALSFKGAQVRFASRGEDALGLCQEQQPDVAFVDFTMPGLSGQSLVARLREIRKQMRIVIMSGRDVDMTEIVGVSDFLKKPFELRDIELKLRSVLAAASFGD